MIELSRTIRFCLNGPTAGAPAGRTNTFSSWPAMRGLGRYYEAHVVCRGEPDPVTGYFINIRDIDEAFRSDVLPYLEYMVAQEQVTSEMPMGSLMRDVHERINDGLAGTVVRVGLSLTPYYSLEIRSNDMASLLIRQQYEFSAAHRLHCPVLSDEKNREVFGKCNNPSGHGHNYRVEVAVRCPINDAGRVLQVEQLDAVVDTAAISKLDHKNLNVDVPEFADRNSSVENIAPVIFEMLQQPILRGLGVELEEVSVWETGKTMCTYRAERGATLATAGDASSSATG